MTHHDKPLSQARFLLSTARLALYSGERPTAESLEGQARTHFTQSGDREKLDTGSLERELMVADRLRAKFLMNDGATREAEDILYEQLSRVRSLYMIHEEMTILTMLAKLKCEQGSLAEAEALLGDVWSWVEFGPYRLLNAEARLVESRIHECARRVEEARLAARRAYDLAFCDGRGYSYEWALVAARAKLQELGESPPALSRSSVVGSFIAAEIDPTDEFFVGP
jgi:ATP/maltotriose-dependent transcriptional regulator MalT